MVTYYAPIRLGDTVSSHHYPFFFPEIDHNVLVSAYNILKSPKMMRICKEKDFRNEVLELGQGTLLADSGAFSYYGKGQGKIKGDPDRGIPTPGELARVYEMMRPEAGFHLDVPIKFLAKDWGQQKLFTPELRPVCSLNQLLERNLARVEECKDAMSHLRNFTLIPVAQGMHAIQYGDQVDELADRGYDLLAIGGLVGRDRSIKEKVGIIKHCCSIARRRDVRLHLLGIGNPRIITEIQSYGVVSSCDSANPTDDAIRTSKGDQAYYYWLDHRTFDLIKIRLVDLWSRETRLPNCKCPLCQLFGREILNFGNSQLNRARSFHNTRMFDRHVRKKFGTS